MTVEIEGRFGQSRIIIKDGYAWFEHSPCDNRICVETGKITMERQWAACMPNGVMIHIEGNGKSRARKNHGNAVEELDALAN